MLLADRLHRLVSAEVDARPVAVTRVVIGVALLLKLVGGVSNLGRLVDPTTMKLPMVGWMPAPTPALVTVLLVLWGVAALCFLAGWRTRSAAGVLALVLGVQLVLDKQTYSNHLYLLVLVVLLLAAADCAAVWSLDARRAPRRTVPAWPVFLLQVQVTIVYMSAALSKVTSDYLSGLALAPFVPFWAGVELLGFTVMATAVLLASWAAIPLELAVGIGLWSRRYRRAAAWLGVLLHTGMVVFMYRQRLDLAVFAVLMWGLYPLFLSRRTAV